MTTNESTKLVYCLESSVAFVTVHYESRVKIFDSKGSKLIVLRSISNILSALVHNMLGYLLVDRIGSRYYHVRLVGTFYCIPTLLNIA